MQVNFEWVEFYCNPLLEIHVLKYISEAQTLQGKTLTTEVGVGFVNFSGYLIKLLSGDGDHSGGDSLMKVGTDVRAWALSILGVNFCAGIRCLAIFNKISNFGTL